jgi:hypothetical protein
VEDCVDKFASRLEKVKALASANTRPQIVTHISKIQKKCSPTPGSKENYKNLFDLSIRRKIFFMSIETIKTKEVIFCLFLFFLKRTKTKNK